VFSRVRLLRPTAVVVLALLLSVAPAWAEVSFKGDVTPSPNPGNPGGGSIAGPLFVGDASVGTLTMTTPTTATAPSTLVVTSGNIIVGNSATASGTVVLQDIGTSFSTNATSDLIIGSTGTGNVSMFTQARIRAGDDLSLGVNAGSTGGLFMGAGTLADIGDDVLVGSAGTGLAQLSAGAQLRADASTVGQTSGSNGSITVSGFASIWKQTGSMTIGEAGNGRADLSLQGRIETTGVIIGNAATGVGIMNINGAGSIWKANGAITLAAGGLGTLQVIDGAQLTSTLATRMATLDGSEAHAVISGPSASWTGPTSMIVGEMGFATLDVRGGARVVTGNTIIGDNAGARGEVIVEGRGSVLTINGTLDVSDPGEADLTIANSGLVTTTGVARVAAAGRLSFVGGRLEVGGAGGLTNNGLIQGGGRIIGNVNNTANAKLRTRVAEVLVLSNTLVNHGIVEMDGGELETGGQLTNNGDIDVQSAILRTGGAGLVNNSGGQFSIVGGQVDVFGAVNNNTGAQIVVGARSTAVFHDALVNNGQFTLFEGSSVIALENLSFTPTSALAVRIGQDEEEVPEFATVESAGQISLNGALNVTLASGFTPTLGDSFQLFTASGGVMGSFAGATLPSLTGGLAWDLDYNAEDVILRVVAGLTADFNGDGFVNSADLGVWKTNFGKAAGAVRAEGDANGDGAVDGTDYLAWQRQLGSSASTGAAAPVPEPASLALIGLAAAGVASRRRSRTR
jgi:T5SS/PEP-CTERM-associated repeat protein